MYSEKLFKLLKACSKNEHETKTIINCVNSSVNYINSIVQFEVQTAANDDGWLRDELRNSTYRALDRVCESIMTLNQISSKYNLENIINLKLEKRTQNTHYRLYVQDNHKKAEDFAYNLIQELYQIGIERLKREEQELSLISDKEDLAKKLGMDNIDLDKNTIIDISSIIGDNSEAFLKLNKNNTLLKIEPNGISEDIIYSVNVTCKEEIPEFNICSRKDNVYYDVPASLLRDLIVSHDGFNLEEPSIENLIAVTNESEKTNNTIEKEIGKEKETINKTTGEDPQL